jgi:hypothetical protein
MGGGSVKDHLLCIDNRFINMNNVTQVEFYDETTADVYFNVTQWDYEQGMGGGGMESVRITGEQAKALYSWLKRNSNILRWGEL